MGSGREINIFVRRLFGYRKSKGVDWGKYKKREKKKSTIGGQNHSVIYDAAFKC